MRVTHQLVQPANIHVSLVLVFDFIFCQLLGVVPVDKPNDATIEKEIYKQAFEHAQILQEAKSNHVGNAEDQGNIRQTQVRVHRGQKAQTHLRRRVFEVRRRVHFAYDKYAHFRNSGH
jgi:hypothetical protein